MPHLPLSYSIPETRSKTVATFTVVIPLKGVDKTHNNKGELVGIPFLGPSQRFIFNDEEMKNWLEMFVAGTTQYNMVYIEKHPDA